MNGYLEKLEASARAVGHLLCLGLDPDPHRIEALLGRGGTAGAEQFLNELLETLEAGGAFPAALKPNLAYFEQYGSAGLALLERLLGRWRGRCPLILDGKRGDIGPSSLAYARALFEVWGADAVTVSPWMGRDSLEPFLERCGPRGVYVLVRTSNPGWADLQGLPCGQEPVWQVLARRLRQERRPGLGAVVGATGPEDLARASRLLEDMPLLVPGVGRQGGRGDQVLAALGAPLARHRVNVSSAILYAGEGRSVDWRQAALEAARRFARELALAGDSPGPNP
ncbi:MAG TPA: orotidine-5'-phosphate decarboxylase [Candidatus Nitrosotenuis sp.]|nr:orotidine-5'-phosphate decarboxylase [Candidatus Nitrosotenuis sp.]